MATAFGPQEISCILIIHCSLRKHDVILPINRHYICIQYTGNMKLEIGSEEMIEMESVCVTGAGGFIASWLVKMLLSRGYTVKGTVRDPDDRKYEHLKELQGADERLQFVKADILDYDSLVIAITGCKGVFHTACPIIEVPAQVLQPAVKGTLNVLKACTELGVKRVILTCSTILLSSIRNCALEIYLL